MINFCTLFDSYYLDKALALYYSLEKVSQDFHLYIFCLDDRARDVLLQENLKYATILHHTDIEAEYSILLKLKKERSKAEYCWTCTPVVIDYVLKHYPVDSCTYIDADLYFFSDPQILFDEIAEAEADIVITEHRFTSSLRDTRLLRRSGKYCVEFNYFNQSANARKALDWWREKCFEWCYHLYEPDRMGDQKYLERFPQMFQGVHELQYLGGGVAPWNLAQYELQTAEGGHIALRTKRGGELFNLVFYHFQNIRYLNDTKVNVNSCTHSKAIKDAIYIPYLMEVEKARKKLQKYDITFSVNKSYASNPLIAFVQKYILQYKIRSWSDLYNLEEIRRLC